jgi:voltage-gated potassium channel
VPQPAPLIPAPPREPVAVELPGGSQPSPGIRILQRLALAILLVCFVAVLTWLDRDGYVDAKEDGVSLLDAFYYATVTVTTTGYGDIRPESDGARLLSTVLVTPCRVLFLIVLVGTTLELLAERTRIAYRLARWRSKLSDHTVIIGFGTKGRAAAHELVARGVPKDEIIVIEMEDRARSRAVAQGFAVVDGDATRTDVLREAGVEDAKAVIIAPDRDDAAVLMTLTVRELNAKARVAAAVREAENAHLLKQGGADTVITSAGAAGRLLGAATREPDVVRVLEDLLVSGDGLELVEHEVEREGMSHAEAADGAPILAIVRDGTPHRFDAADVATLRAGDRVVCLCRNGS